MVNTRAVYRHSGDSGSLSLQACGRMACPHPRLELGVSAGLVSANVVCWGDMCVYPERRHWEPGSFYPGLDDLNISRSQLLGHSGSWTTSWTQADPWCYKWSMSHQTLPPRSCPASQCKHPPSSSLFDFTSLVTHGVQGMSWMVPVASQVLHGVSNVERTNILRISNFKQWRPDIGTFLRYYFCNRKSMILDSDGLKFDNQTY